MDIYWDAENRLIAMESISSVPAAAKKKLEFEYDHRWRRTSKTVYNWNAGTSSYDLAETRCFIYDEWNLIAELDESEELLCSYVWGDDLSGNRRGAGGVGGLVMLSHHAKGDHFAGYDGNGNVMVLVNGSTGSHSATYEYGPFGEVIRMTGPMAEVNPFRFSTKFQDRETGLNYYGYRFYNARIGRWLNGDPVGETGGVNLYGFISNQPLLGIDLLGLRLTPYSGHVAGVPIIPKASLGTFVDQHGEVRHYGAATEVTNFPAAVTTTKSEETRKTLFGSKKMYRVTAVGSIAFKIFYDPRATPNPYQPLQRLNGQSIARHEREHVKIARDEWNRLVSYVAAYEGAYCKSKCADQAEYVIQLAAAAFEEKARVAHDDWDMKSYGASRATPDRGPMNHPGAYLTAAVNRFKQMKCKKK
jgi:RHS repeat-associated protein